MGAEKHAQRRFHTDHIRLQDGVRDVNTLHKGSTVLGPFHPPTNPCRSPIMNEPDSSCLALNVDRVLNGAF